MQIFFKTSTGKKITLEVEPSETIKEIREKIKKEEEGIYLENQNLVFARRQLEDDRTLEDYNIKNDSIIHSVTKTGGIIFKIKFENKIFKTEKWCPCCKKGIDLKEFMNKKTGNEKDNIELKFNNNIIEDDLSLEVQKINDNDFIDMILKKIKLIIKKSNKEKNEIICENNLNILNLKEKIKDKIKNLDKFILVYNYKILNDEKFLNDYKIQNKSEIMIITE